MEANYLNVSNHSNFPPIGFEDENDSDNTEQDNNKNDFENEIVSLDKKEKKTIIDEEEEEYFKSYKNMFESQIEAPPEIDEDYLIQDEEEMLKDISNEKENEYLISMYEESIIQQKLSSQKENKEQNDNINSTLSNSNLLSSEVSIKQKGKRPALDFEDEDNDFDFSMLSNNYEINNSKNISSSLNTQNTQLKHKDKKSQTWNTGNTELGFGFTDDSFEPLEWNKRPDAGTVYLTGYSYDNLPLYIPFKPIPTVNEIHHYNKELTAKNMNGQLLDVSIYQLIDELEKEKKEKKELQEAKDYIRQYNNNGVNEEEYMNIWGNDANKKKNKDDKKMNMKKIFGINREVLSWNNDKYKRPFKKIMLLAGPPGLGKTTLAHVVAKHCGYNVVEINASDDRTGNTVKNKLLSALEMQNITNGKPNLVIIDEIDGVSGKGSGDQNFIKLLINIVTAEASNPNEKRRGRGKRFKPLLRPIICICNDQYAPALKPLRTIAQIYTFKPPQPKQLAKRLKEICDNSYLKTDIRTLLALCELTECDIRNCINTLQFINSKNEELTLETLSHVSIGHKDLNKSLFNIWENIFTFPKASEKRSYTLGQNLREEKQNNLSNRYISRLVSLINSNGEYEKIIIGCYENYIKLKTINFSSDPNKSKYVLISEWLEFYDYINLHISKFAHFELSEYAIYPIISFYRLFASSSLRAAFPLAPYQANPERLTSINRYRKPQPILEYPRHDYEAHVAHSTNLSILNQFISGINSQLQYNGWNYEEVISGLISYLLRITEPNIKTSNVLLLKPDDRKKLTNLVEILVSFGLSCIQEKVPDSSNYIYKLEPPIGHLVDFNNLYSKIDQESNISQFIKNKDKFGFDFVNYQIQQIVAQEVEMEKMRRIENSLIKSTTQDLENLSLQNSAKTNNELSKNKMIIDQFNDKKAQQKKQEDLEKIKENDRKRISELKKASKEGVMNSFTKPFEDEDKKISNVIDMKEFFKVQTDESTVSNDKPSTTNISGDIWYRYNEGYSNAVRTTVYIKDL
ncbi:hypothetical protein H8356DRAFT_1756084 [Neocallimastix lanati (nom. inval.)]|nr:hypothetical protein H8356DRAFT_1756084 [Neocallimastix sp. JGI-2020a]